jgi:hypothetical protein
VTTTIDRRAAPRRNVVSRALTLLLAGAVCCQRQDVRPDSPAAVAGAIPSPPAARAPATSESDTAPAFGTGTPYPGSWTPTAVHQDSLFTIDYPASAKIEQRPPEPRYGRPNHELIIGPLPECKWDCRMTIVVRRDSTHDVLARLVAAVRKPEPLNDDEMAEGRESVIDSIPFGPDPAVHFSDYCGDCNKYEFVTTHYPWVATIDYALDDREGYSPALLARIASVARTFRWRR